MFSFCAVYTLAMTLEVLCKEKKVISFVVQLLNQVLFVQLFSIYETMELLFSKKKKTSWPFRVSSFITLLLLIDVSFFKEKTHLGCENIKWDKERKITETEGVKEC